MPSYKVPLDDIQFLLHDVLNADQLQTLDGYEEADLETIGAILEEAAKLAENELAPLNQVGDLQGCQFENGVVRTPDGFKEAYEKFIEGGWTRVSNDPDYGGFGMPHLVQFVLEEMWCGSNMAFSMYPGLSHGAYEALHKWGSEELKNLYLPKLVDGVWSGTMCLTEPHCGTDLGLLRTKAEPQDDGSYALTGTKIFISAGEQDLTENIVHLVLARLPDAPEGIKGISLFIVPKFIPNESGDVGARNNVACGSIEHKMGIKGSATCVMNFDGAAGWLVGAPHKGMRAMFTMMNAARLAVGIQGMALADASYQNAAAYAKDRTQGRSLDGEKYPEKSADPIIVHPDVRKNLLTMRAMTEGQRALAYWVGLALDYEDRHPDPTIRQESADLVALMTPIIKSFLTDKGFENCSIGIQVLGGHGYIHEWGLEQFARDARITQIYEGANGIQALDLVGRKMGQDMGRLLRRFFHPVQQLIEAEQNNPALMEFLIPFMKAFGKLQQATALVAQKGMKNPIEAGAASTDYLNLFGYVAVGYMWLRMIKVAQEKLASEEGDAGFYQNKIHLGRFYFQKLMPQANALNLSIMAGADPLMAMADEAF